MKNLLKRPAIIVAIVLAVTVFMGIQIPRVVLDNDVLEFFPDDHPSYVRMKALDDIYESQIMFDICITEKDGTFLNNRTIQAIKEISEIVEAYPAVDDLSSVINTDFPDGSSEGMIVEPLITEGFSGTDEEIAQLKTNLLDWPDMYKNSLYSEDFKSTQILVVVNKDATHEEKNAIYDGIVDFTKVYDWLDVRVAGDPVISHDAEIFMIADLTALIPLVMLVLLVSLYLAFHRLGGTLLPMITVLITTIWTVGIMALFNVPFSIVSTCLPVLLIAIGSAYGIHVMTHYYTDMRQQDGKISGEKHKEIVISSVEQVLQPVILAGFTTIVGFSSIITSPIVPLKTFGLFSTIGTVIALVLSLTFIPALMIMGYREHSESKGAALQEEKIQRREEKSHKRMEAVYKRMSRHRIGVLVVTLFVVIISAYGLSKMNIESALIDYFPKDSSIRVNADYISDNFAGTNTFNVVVKGENRGDVIEPQVLNEMDNLKQYLLAKNPDIGKIMTYTDFIKRMNQVMNFPADENSEDFGSYEYGETIDSGSFFGSDNSADSGSFFAADDSADSGSFFGDAEEEPSEASAISFEPLSITDDLTWATLIDLARKIVHEKGNGELSVEDLTNEVEKAFNIRGKAYYEIPSDLTKYAASSNEELKT